MCGFPNSQPFEKSRKNKFKWKFHKSMAQNVIPETIEFKTGCHTCNATFPPAKRHCPLLVRNYSRWQSYITGLKVRGNGMVCHTSTSCVSSKLYTASLLINTIPVCYTANIDHNACNLHDYLKTYSTVLSRRVWFSTQNAPETVKQFKQWDYLEKGRCANLYVLCTVTHLSHFQPCWYTCMNNLLRIIT